MRKVVFLTLMILSVGCHQSNSEKDEAIRPPESYLQLEALLFEKSEQDKSNRLQFSIGMPYLHPDDSLVLVNGFLMDNRKIELVDTLFANELLDSTFSNDDFEMLFNIHFKSTEHDWVLNLMLQQRFNLHEIDLRLFIPSNSKKWRKEVKEEHGKYWKAFFRDSSSFGDL